MSGHDELHAAIAAYLRRQRRPLPRPTAAEAGDHPLRGLRTGPFVPRCRVCGAPVDNDDGLFNLADMQRVRECHLHYAPF
jgi:hypothetical protein